MRRLKGASLLEAMVAAAVFLTVFAAVMELLPRLAVREDDALLLAEAEYAAAQAFDRYASEQRPCGDYAERCAWGCITVRVERYGACEELRIVTVEARIDGSRKRIVRKQLVAWSE